MIGGIILACMYCSAIFAEFISPYHPATRHKKFIHCPPQKIHFQDAEGKFHFRPFVYELKSGLDKKTWHRTYLEDTSKIRPIYLFVKGESYKFLGLFKTERHLFGVKEGTLFLFGTERLGRDMFSRSIFAARISLSIGLAGVAMSFILGLTLGGISGYYGGAIDTFIQRVIEILLAIPMIPFWMALSAALPRHWSSIKVYFAITIILALRNWCYLARVVRGKLLELREQDYVMAAKFAGAREGMIIRRHLLPAFLSYLIVNLTLAVPFMIIGETSLSFLGLGLRPPVVSWGVLLKEAQNVRSVVIHPWLLIPGAFVIVTVLAFNFLGDGLRDAADPYK
jgi:peptide/nickel transport system permease protein